MRITVFRIRLCATVLGCIILAASLFDWMRLLQVADGYSWVGVEASSAPGLETAEVWQVRASCTRSFFVKALFQAKAKLKAYYDRAPEEVRAWHNGEMRIDAVERSQEQRGAGTAVKMRHSRRTEADAEREAWLQVQYAEWFATVYELEIEKKRWQQRLENVADQNLVISDSTRKSFAAYSINDDGAEGANAFERHVLFLLGLSGFAKDEEQALKSDCVKVTPIKKIFTQTSAMRELWHWPFNHIAAFSLGLELILVSILFVPIALWIRAGDLRVSGNYLRRSTRRLVARTMTLHRRKFILDTFSALHLHIRARLVPALVRIFAQLAAAAKYFHGRLLVMARTISLNNGSSSMQQNARDRRPNSNDG